MAGLKGEGLDATGYSFDVVNRQRVTEQVGRIEREIGPIDIRVNSAGNQKRAPILYTEEAVWREVLDVNLTGVFLTTELTPLDSLLAVSLSTTARSAEPSESKNFL